MQNPLKSSAAANLGVLLARLPLGVIFFLYGLGNIKDVGVKTFVDQNTPNLPTILPKPIGQTYLYAIPFLEIICGTLLILGLFTRTSAFIIAMMLVTFLIGYQARNANYYWMMQQFNATFVGLALLLATTGGGRISLDRSFFGDDGMGH